MMGFAQINIKSTNNYLRLVLSYNNIIIMSKNLDDAKLRRMVDKYRKFKAKHADQAKESTTEGCLRGILQKCEWCWCKIVPTCVRDFRGEFELFNSYWQTEMGKTCSNPLISRLSLEENLKAYKVGQPVVLGLIYSPQSIPKALNFINHLRVDDLKGEVMLCPISTEGRVYRSDIEPKIILFQDTIAIFWRGLFDEMILLSKFRMQEVDLFKTVKAEVAARIEYQARIRQMAEAGKFNENTSQILM